MTSDQDNLLRRYAQDLINSPLHLTSVGDQQIFWKRHVQDAIQLNAIVSVISQKTGTRVIDVGSGNGIPGLPLAILNPEWVVKLLDSDNKKCSFLDTFCKNNTIKNCEIIVGRAETEGHSSLRQAFDIAFARALGKLPTALELSGPFLRLGGLLIVPHGTSWHDELRRSDNALRNIGLEFIGDNPYSLDGPQFHALAFRKIKETPPIYPRRVGVPTKRPL